jgi:hypothetical protein
MYVFLQENKNLTSISLFLLFIIVFHFKIVKIYELVKCNLFITEILIIVL